MKIFNNINEMPLMRRLAEMDRDRYQSSGDYSVTSLITPPRIVRLQKRHADEILLDPESMVASMTGTAVHEWADKYLTMWMEKNDTYDMVLEEELTSIIQDRVISGRYDIRIGDDLFDIKNVKTWKLIFDPNFQEFHEQQNLYNYLLYKQGVKLRSLNLLVFYKDWTEGNALRDKSYPQSPVVQYELDMWPLGETAEFLAKRLEMHIACEEIPDDDLPICSREERWERHQGGETVHYAIFKKTQAKRATKVIKGGDLAGAIQVANGLKGMTTDSFIEVRFALPKRCVKYCGVNIFCNWYQAWLKKGGGVPINEIVKFKA